MMAIWLCWLTYFSALTFADEVIWKKSVGKGFFLPDEEIDNPLHVAPLDVFETLHESCFDSNNISISKDAQSFFKDTAAVYTTISTDSSIDVKLEGMYTMGNTLNYKTAGLSDGQVEVKGSSINILKYVRAAIIDTECYIGSQTHLTGDLIKSLDALPEVVEKPEEPSSWDRYEDFFKSYGSHIVTQTYYGSSIKQWSFVKKDRNYTEEQLRIKACAYLAGTSNLSELEIDACSNITQEQVKNVSSIRMTHKLEIRGGSDITRKQLENIRTRKLITKFLNESIGNYKAIQYKYTPIWDILRSKYPRDSDPLRNAAIRLQEYYMGFKDFGCSLIKSDDGKYKLRRFQLSEDGREQVKQHYDCVLEREGCHNDTDCHDSGAFQSHCYGPGCVEYLPAVDGSKAERARIRSIKTGGDSEGINQSCKYQKKQTGRNVKCNLQFSQDHIIWNGKKAVVTRPKPSDRPIAPISGTANIKLDKLWCLLGIMCLCSTHIFI